jgi:putative inorganic carbon (HCO3(-)) transporter
MRGLVLFIIFTGLLFLVFKRPFVGILMWFWISLMNPHRLVYGFFETSISYALITAVVTLGSWILLHPEEPKFPPRDRITFLIVALMIWFSITSLTGMGPLAEIVDRWSTAEKMLLMTLVAYTMTNTRERFDQVVLICALSIAYYGFSGGIFAILHGGADRIYGPPGSMIGDNNTLGLALVMNLPMLFYLNQRYVQPHFMWPLRALIGLTIIVIISTYSRGALLALAAMAAILWLRSRLKATTGIVIVIAVMGVLHFAPESWFDRMHTIQSYGEDESAESRLWMWQVSWEIAKKHPIVGAGFHWGWNWPWVNQQIQGSGLHPLTIPRASHSIWFQMLSDHGFVGLTLFVVFLLVAMLNARWLIRRTRGCPELLWANNFGRLSQAALVGYMVGGSFASLEIYDGFYALVLMGSIAQQLVATELAARDRTAKAPLTGTLSLAATSQAQLGRSSLRT